jgi:hypothetical protein
MDKKVLIKAQRESLEQANRFFQRHYGSLEGWTITKFIGMSEDSFGGKAFPQFLINKGEQASIMEISQDEEGNGGGFIFHDLMEKKQ